MKLIFIHGNGGATADMIWYPSAGQRLQQSGYEVIRETLPDNEIAHENIWIPYIKEILCADEHSVLIGHSSGAIAALRYAEQYPIFGSVLISPYHTDLHIETEREGGWFNRPWSWDKISSNQHWIIQFSSIDDPWIPIAEARYIHSQLNTDYFEFLDRGHFEQDNIAEFPELISSIDNKIHL